MQKKLTGEPVVIRSMEKSDIPKMAKLMSNSDYIGLFIRKLEQMFDNGDGDFTVFEHATQKPAVNNLIGYFHIHPTDDNKTVGIARFKWSREVYQPVKMNIQALVLASLEKYQVTNLLVELHDDDKIEIFNEFDFAKINTDEVLRLAPNLYPLITKYNSKYVNKTVANSIGGNHE